MVGLREGEGHVVVPGDVPAVGAMGKYQWWGASAKVFVS